MVKSSSLSRDQLISGSDRVDDRPVYRVVGAGSTGQTLMEETDWEYATTIQVKEFESLESNWDSYHAPEVSLSSINRALSLVEEFAELEWKPFVAPTGDGGIEFEWATGEFRFSITLTGEGWVELFYYLPDGREWYGRVPDVPPDDLNDVYKSLLEARQS